MDESAPPVAARHARLDWRLVAGLNLLLGALLWFMDCTDYSWASNVADELFGPAVATLALASLFAVRRCHRPHRRLARLACLPSLLEGGAQLALILLLFVPPFTLGGMFWLGEISNERLIQQAVSPDGRRVAGGYFRGVGSYTGGNGRIYVRVRDQRLPFVERDVYYLSRSYASGRPEEYLLWRDNDTLYMTEKQVEVRIGRVSMEYPFVIAVPRFIVEWVT